MSSTGKKEYSLKINGIEKEIQNATSLEEALRGVGAAIDELNKKGVAAGKVSKEKAAAMTEEEKASKKLAETQEKVKQANTEANREQIKATQALREANREAARRVQIESLAEGSVKRLGMELTDLRNRYDQLSRAERNSEEVGRPLLAQIQAMDAEYKNLKESTGRFQDNVGNYSSALDGLKKLNFGIEGVTKSSLGMAQALLGTTAVMALFGSQSEQDAERARFLQKTIAILSLAQAVNTNILKEGIIQGKVSAAVTALQTLQTRAKTKAEALATKGTIAATIAQKAFNAVAMLNPYVLLAAALAGVVIGLIAFASGTKKAADEQKRANEQSAIYLDQLDAEAKARKVASDERLAALNREMQVLQARGASQAEIAKKEDEIFKEKKAQNTYLRGLYTDEIADLKTNRKELKYLEDQLNGARLAKERFGNKKIDIEIDGKNMRVKAEKAIELLQGEVDNTQRKVQIAVELNAEQAGLDAEQQAAAERRKKELKEQAKAERDILRQGEDARIALIRDSDERERQTTLTNYRRQIEDLRARLREEVDLTAAARTGINELIASLEKKQDQDLEALERGRQARARQLRQEGEDSLIALEQDAYQRRLAEIGAQYNREIDIYQKQVNSINDILNDQETVKNLSEGRITQLKEEQATITMLITNATKARAQAVGQLEAESLAQRAALTLETVDNTLYAVENKIGQVIVRSKTGLELIDVEATRANLEAANAALDEFIAGQRQYLAELKEAHIATLSTLKEGTPEYEAEQQKYARAVEDATARIIGAQQEQIVNGKLHKEAMLKHIEELIGKIGGYAQGVADVISSVAETFNKGLQMQIDDLTAQLETVNARYEEAKKIREDSVKQTEELEARLRDASGTTAEAVRAQLLDAAAARAEAEREEQRLAREKEKREAEIARKEKQMRRADLLANIATGIANTAQAVTKTLAAFPWPASVVPAAIVGAMGAVQTGLMVAQLAKLKDGGEIVGPSHEQGGVPIAVRGRYAYEAQGGEFMVNDRSYATNKALVNFINDQPRALSFSDIARVLPADNRPIVVSGAGSVGEDRILEAIRAVNFRPVVAVTDIADVSDTLTEVTDAAGFS